MDDLCDMTLDKFKLWSLNALKVFLSRRNKSVNGTFEELSARAFCAWEENLPINEKAEQMEMRLLDEYKAKLKVEGDILPDPFSLSFGWKGEKDAMTTWPSVYITDISQYLNCSTPKEVMHRLLNEYKEGKAYRYFDCEWVKEIYVHNIRQTSDKCFLKAKVTPSQSVNSKNYDVWVLVRKDGKDRPGGEILQGYCTCTAGMLGTCNHVAGVLFRIEHAVKTGLTKVSSTSVACAWNIPRTKTCVKPTKVSDIPWRKSHYNKNKIDFEREKTKLSLKNAFTPLTKAQHTEVQDEIALQNRLYDIVKNDAPDSCFTLLHEKRRIASQKPDIPPSLIESAENVKSVCNLGLSEKQLEEKYLETIRMTEEECDKLEENTRDQSFSNVWTNQRKGRVTASSFHRVCSRVNTLQKDESADPSALIKTVMGKNDCMPTMAMKHGISMEPHAKRAYSQDMKKNHKQFKSTDSGLSVCADAPYLGASADLKVECACCGKGLCEIKCPETIKNSVPSEQNVVYIKKEKNEYVLDKTHQYYFQIQGQMGILGRNYCDLFIYTYHGQLQLRVMFDESFWKSLKDKLSWFWMNYMLKELLKDKELVDENTFRSPLEFVTCSTHPSTPKPKQSPPKISPPSIKSKNSNVRRALQTITPRSNTKSHPKKFRKTKVKTPIYLCGTCGLECLDDPQTEDEQSVHCDKCNVWVHYVCANVDDEKLANVKQWSCDKCK